MNYEEKLREIINSNSEYYPSEDKAVFAKYFPELKEDKDERIRKGITSILEHYKESGEIVCPYPFVSIDEAITWLEKQGKRDARYKYLEELLEADAIYQIAMNNAMVEEAKMKALKAISNMGIFELLGLEKQGENKKLDANKVIEWLKNTIRETKEYFGENNMYYNTRLISPYDSIEDLINDFKKDFKL